MRKLRRIALLSALLLIASSPVGADGCEWYDCLDTGQGASCWLMFYYDPAFKYAFDCRAMRDCGTEPGQICGTWCRYTFCYEA